MSDVLLDNAVIVITGARNTGKTGLASTYIPPNRVGRVFYHDSEWSSNWVVQQLEQAGMSFGYYSNLSARFANMPGEDDLLSRLSDGKPPWVDEEQKSAMVGYWHYVMEDLRQHLAPGQFDVYIHDTLEKMEAGMAAEVEENKRQYGVKSTAFGGLWNAGVYPLYEGFVSSIFARGVKTIILTSHLKTPWEGNRPVVGKVAPSGKRLLYRLSSLFLWLVNNRDNPDNAPAALVLKERLGRLQVVDGQWRIRRVLPERVPHCTWVDVKRYLEEGCDLAHPKPGETMTEAERQMISPLLTDEQMRLMVLDAQKELEQIKADQGVSIFGGTPPAGAPALPMEQPATQAPPAPTAAATDLRTRVRALSLDHTAEQIREALTGEAPPPILDAIIREEVGG